MSSADPDETLLKGSSMRKIFRSLIVLCFLIATASMAHSQECPILTTADVQTITGTQVQNVPFGSKPGAGGRCANFATTDGHLYLGVSQLASAPDYNKTIAAVPESVYPRREKLTGVGDEAILMKDSTGQLRYLVAHKGDRGVVLFPFRQKGQPQQSPNDEQLRKLAIAALSH